MVEQLVHVEPPRELAGREIKRNYSEELESPNMKSGNLCDLVPGQNDFDLEPAEG